MILQAILRGYRSLVARGVINIDQVPEPYRTEIAGN